MIQSQVLLLGQARYGSERSGSPVVTDFHDGRKEEHDRAGYDRRRQSDMPIGEPHIRADAPVGRERYHAANCK